MKIEQVIYSPLNANVKIYKDVFYIILSDLGFNFSFPNYKIRIMMSATQEDVLLFNYHDHVTTFIDEFGKIFDWSTVYESRDLLFRNIKQFFNLFLDQYTKKRLIQELYVEKQKLIEKTLEEQQKHVEYLIEQLNDIRKITGC